MPRLVIAAVVSLLIAAPFLLPLALRYQFRMLNRTPVTWAYPDAALESLLESFDTLTIVLMVLWILGAIALASDRHRLETRVLAVWGAVTVLLAAYCGAAQDITWLPALISAYHFQFQTLAWSWLVVGAAVVTIVNSQARRWSAPPQYARAGILAAVIVFSAALYPTYLRRSATTNAVSYAEELGASPWHSLYEWIRTATPSDAVFLASQVDGLMSVAPAARHVVCADVNFSNPYVDYEQRAAIQERMWDALGRAQWAEFLQLARPHGVTHILVSGERAAHLPGSPFAEIFSAGESAVFRITATG
jgi:hypothetical protein